MEAVGTSNANTLTSFNYPQYPKHRVNARELYINLHLLLISALFCAVSQHFLLYTNRVGATVTDSSPEWPPCSIKKTWTAQAETVDVRTTV